MPIFQLARPSGGRSLRQDVAEACFQPHASTGDASTCRTILPRLQPPGFYDRVIKVAMLAAGFSAGEADQLRRAMGAWKRKDVVGIAQNLVPV